MPERIDKPGTAIQFVYRCVHPGCAHEDRYRDTVRRHEWYEHEITLVRDERGSIIARARNS